MHHFRLRRVRGADHPSLSVVLGRLLGQGIDWWVSFSEGSKPILLDAVSDELPSTVKKFVEVPSRTMRRMRVWLRAKSRSVRFLPGIVRTVATDLRCPRGGSSIVLQLIAEVGNAFTTNQRC